MIYDPKSGALYSDDGVFLKTVYCPLSTLQKEFQKLTEDSPDRRCTGCGETVHSLDNLSDDDVRRLLSEKPNACVFATSNAKNLVIKQENGQSLAPHGYALIKTAKSMQALTEARNQGLKLLVRSTRIESVTASLNHNVPQPGRASVRRLKDSFREVLPDVEAQRLLQMFYDAKYEEPLPVAAYLIPGDLVPGARVYVEELIAEDIPSVYWNHSDGPGVISSRGTWTGKTIELDVSIDSACPTVEG
jgi:hypothetical protein